MSLDYDPLSALAVRISTPEERQFLASHYDVISAEIGADAALDLESALAAGDMPAARRFAAAVCADAEFGEPMSGEGATEIAWSSGDASGSTKVFDGQSAAALVIAAVTARDALRSISAPGLTR